MKNLLLAAGTVLALASTAAHAEWDWWLVFGFADTPQRTFVYVDQASIKQFEGLPSETPYWRVDVGRVFEAPDADDYVMTTYDLRCGTTPQGATQRVYFQGRFLRDYSLQTITSDPKNPRPFETVGNDPSLLRVAEFVCDPDSRTADNGMISGVSKEMRPTDATWAIFWTDGTRPPYVQNRTMDELNAEHDALVARVGARRAVTDSMAGQLAAMDAGDRDGRQRVERRRREAGKYRSWSADAQVHKTLETWMSRSEQDLVSTWGAPHRSHETNGIRFLAYEFGHDVVSYQSGAFGTGETGRSQYRCNVQFESRQGELIDFRVSGNHCTEVIK